MAWDLKLHQCYASVYEGPQQQRRIDVFKELVKKYSEDPTKKNLQIGVGHGCGKIGHNWTSLDPYDKRDVIDVREKLEETTLPSDTFDFIVCNAILEHVEDPFGCVRSMYRVAKPGAIVWVEVPFVQPYHPSKTWELIHGMFPKEAEHKDDENHGGDYWRFTPMGTVQLMKPFRMLEVMLINQGGIVFYGDKV